MATKLAPAIAASSALNVGVSERGGLCGPRYRVAIRRTSHGIYMRDQGEAPPLRKLIIRELRQLRQT